MGRGSHLCGVIKTKARPLVESLYGFEVSGANAVPFNRKLAEELKTDFAFVYCVHTSDLIHPTILTFVQVRGKGDEPHKGLYEHKIIQKLVNLVWFGKKKLSPGVRFTDVFSPFTDVGLALCLTGVCHPH